MAAMSEDDLIASFFAPLAGEGGLGLADDVARLALSENHELIVTTDGVVAGVHFFPDDPPESIARKALRVNLSDLAAKGARPLGYLLTLALPEGWTRDWLAAFAAALGEDARTYHCPLLGGDTVRTPGPLTIAITALGETPRGAMTARTTARVGDVVAVTGSVGDGALGLAVRHARAEATPPAWVAAIGEERAGALLQRYLEPLPRNCMAEAVRGWASCAMDVSDGLVGDLRKLTAASGVSASVDLDLVPISEAAAAALAVDDGLARQIFAGGDDYEILLTVAPEHYDALAAAARAAGCGLTPIGEITPINEPFRVVWRGAPAAFGKGSFSHF
ncbi:thiamine-monophosphate kinase [Camelimonas fluminis]|uniref:Thiamine-monophosphate kinase n=1 Tax=Camelimonas fluminis TaxID=1576911 RepID=A0ABV7UMQ7_9HYPH|nr:thiamine-phosphate kinase [Camelimonas fluminis]GHE57115.1 thiamine-monophosphate kinase [Camelimonas fluminis]